MSTFGVLPIAGSGLSVDQTWLDTIGGNIANANDQSTPGKPVYQPEYIDAVPVPSTGPGTGVGIGAIALGSATGVLEYDPANPKANKAGYIAVPAVDMATEMVGLEAAQANYQANAAVVRDAVNAYDAVLAIKA
jgi:flagellar basal-body rod protein FlgC